MYAPQLELQFFQLFVKMVETALPLLGPERGIIVCILISQLNNGNVHVHVRWYRWYIVNINFLTLDRSDTRCGTGSFLL